MATNWLSILEKNQGIVASHRFTERHVNTFFIHPSWLKLTLPTNFRDTPFGEIAPIRGVSNVGFIFAKHLRWISPFWIHWINPEAHDTYPKPESSGVKASYSKLFFHDQSKKQQTKQETNHGLQQKDTHKKKDGSFSMVESVMHEWLIHGC